MPYRLLVLTWAMAAAVHGALAPLPADPRIQEFSFSSHALARDKQFVAVLPPPSDRPPAEGFPTLFLLHGRGRNRRSLVADPATRASLLASHLLIVLPDGDDGWYINSPAIPADRYEDYLQEVIDEAGKRVPAAHSPHRRAIAGWSMGGYGAIHFAEAHPEEFAAAAAMIGLLDFPRPADLPPGENYQVPVARFGPDPAVWKQWNPLNRIEALRSLPLLTITAKGSFDRDMNRNFAARARSAGVQITTEELEGAHTFATVTASLPHVLHFVATHLPQ